MNIIELATKRLQELAQTGVTASPAVHHASANAQRVGTVPNVPPGFISRVEEKANRAEEVSAKESPAEDYRRVARRSEQVELNVERLEECGVLVSTRSRSTMAEEFRHIKRPLLANVRKGDRVPGDRSSLIMVTSALPGEGKTFCAINIAASMAIEIDVSVLLVDADVVRCNLMRSLGLPPRKGLLDVLTDPAVDLSDVMLKTNVPRLSILPAGTCNVRSTELLASDAMDRLLGEIASRYPDRVVIFDATPLLLTSEAKVLASHMGQIVMVVEEAKTPYATLQQAFAAVEQCPIVMSILNKGKNDRPDYGSYYG